MPEISVPPVRDPMDSSIDIMRTILEEVRASRTEQSKTTADIRAELSKTSDGIRGEVHELHEELVDSKVAIIRLAEQMKSMQDGHETWRKGLEERVRKIESDARGLGGKFEVHTTDEKAWQVKQSAEVANISKQLSVVLPLAKAHEELVIKAKGAVQATRILYSLAGAVAGALATVSGWSVLAAKPEEPPQRMTYVIERAPASMGSATYEDDGGLPMSYASSAPSASPAPSSSIRYYTTY